MSDNGATDKVEWIVEEVEGHIYDFSPEQIARILESIAYHRFREVES